MITNSPERKDVKVDLGDRSYDIHIGRGLLQEAGKLISDIAPNARCVIVSDENVLKAHGETLGESLSKAGIEFSTLAVPAGEKSKSIEMLNSVVEGLLDAKMERGDLVIAFGGGVVGDLAGFAAAVTRRGMDFIQIPTSLLAQVDSSVGGKTGINSPHGKNLIGAFHQPLMVIADTDVLKTLSEREFKAGYAEVAKYGLINRPDFFDWLEKNREGIFSIGAPLIEAVATSCQCKADVVKDDEKENGIRALLNLGHTFGHALEGATQYDSARLVHGEGVSIGMVLAHQFSNRMNLCDMDTVKRVEAHLKACGLPTHPNEIPGELPPAEKLLDFIAQDKKVTRGKLNFILTKGLGQSYVANDVPTSEVLSFLKETLKS